MARWSRIRRQAFDLLHIAVSVSVVMLLIAIPYRFLTRTPVSKAAEPTYRIRPLTVPGLKVAVPLAVNNSGVAAGYAHDGEDIKSLTPIVWKDGKAVKLRVPRSYGLALPLAINDRGDIVGMVLDKDGGTAGILWEGESESRVRIIRMGDKQVSARTINNRREIAVLTIGNEPPYVESVLLGQGQKTVLGNFVAIGLNDRGAVCGVRPDGASGQQAVLWRGGKLEDLPQGEGMEWGVALAVNNRGEAAGAVGTEDDIFATLWRNGQPERLSENPSAVYGLDDSGICGGVEVVGQNEIRAMLWKGGSAVPLEERVKNGGGWQLPLLNAMSGRGHIVGLGIHQEKVSGYLLTRE